MDFLLIVIRKLIPEFFIKGQKIIGNWKSSRVATIIVDGHLDVLPEGREEYFTHAPVMFGGEWIDGRPA